MIAFFKKILAKVVDVLPIKKLILFESCPDFSDNTKSVFDELVSRHINEQYKFVWICFDQSDTFRHQRKNVSSIFVKKQKLKYFFLSHTAKMVVCCNRFIGSGRKGQTILYLMHGVPMKDTSGYYTVPSKVNWMIVPSPQISKECSYYANCPIEKCVPLGYPRNDCLISSHIDLAGLFGNYKKYIVWYPTVKQFIGGRTTGSIQPIPLIYNEDNCEKLNECAKQEEVLIIIKPHFAQIPQLIKKMKNSNIVFIDDDYFLSKGIKSYEFVASCDALITDYSSIYFDYTLCDKPICLVWEDIEDYKKNPGLIENFEELTIGGEKVFDIDGLNDFIRRVSNSQDLLRVERNTICNRVHAYRDGQSSSRVSDFIVNKLKD